MLLDLWYESYEQDRWRGIPGSLPGWMDTKWKDIGIEIGLAVDRKEVALPRNFVGSSYGSPS